MVTGHALRAAWGDVVEEIGGIDGRASWPWQRRGRRQTCRTVRPARRGCPEWVPIGFAGVRQLVFPEWRCAVQDRSAYGFPRMMAKRLYLRGHIAASRRISRTCKRRGCERGASAIAKRLGV